MKAVVFGGYGTFGRLVCRELARLGVAVTVAGRRRTAAEALARELGTAHAPLLADVTDAAACRAALVGQSVAVNCAGPFSCLGRALLDACFEARCPAVDIADDRGWARLVRGESARLQERGLAAVYGASSLPGLSGALARLAAADAATPPERARVTLFIGNDNPKGQAAIASLVGGLGRPVLAPQGTRRGFGDREVVALPAPFGRRAVYAFDSPDYDLLPDQIGVGSVTVNVAFESRAATLAFAGLARLGAHWGSRTSALCARAGRLGRGGSSGGVVMTELFWSDGASRRAALLAPRDGQRMAALPAALAAHALATGSARGQGALTPGELLGAEALVAQVAAQGFSLLRS